MQPPVLRPCNSPEIQVEAMMTREQLESYRTRLRDLAGRLDGTVQSLEDHLP